MDYYLLVSRHGETIVSLGAQRLEMLGGPIVSSRSRLGHDNFDVDAVRFETD